MVSLARRAQVSWPLLLLSLFDCNGNGSCGCLSEVIHNAPNRVQEKLKRDVVATVLLC